MPWREFWLIERKGRKFWKIQLAGNSYTVVAGRKGSRGRTTTREFPTRQEAEGEYLEAIAVILGKGYREGQEEPASIHDAIVERNLAAFRELLHANPGFITARAEDGETLLHVVVRNGQREMARLLLEAGADVNARGGEDGDTPFGVAITDFSSSIKTDVEMVKLLLRYQPDLSIADQYGDTLSYRVALDKDLAKLAKKHGIAGDQDSTPDLLADLQLKGMAHVQKQLEANPRLLSSPQIGDVLGSAVCMWRDRARGFVSFLLDQGVSPNVTCHGQPLIEWAVQQGGGPKVVRLLLERGADLKRLKNCGRALLLQAISVRREKEIINDLIRYGVKEDLIVQLQMQGPKKVLAELHRDPAQLRELDDPVELLMWGLGNEKLAKLLLQLGVDPNAHGADRNSPLRLAVRNANVNVVRLLLDHGADPNPKDAQGQYPVLYEGMQEGNAKRIKEIVELLIARGARTMPDAHEEWMKRLDALIARRARGKRK